MPDKPSSKNRRRLPPVETRWKKGESGNPKGRPKKQDSLTSLLREEIKKICPADREKRTWKELIVGATLQLAMKGNAAALREVWDRLDGKILQTGNCRWVMLMANRLILMWFMRMMKRVISMVLPQSTVCKIRITI